MKEIYMTYGFARWRLIFIPIIVAFLVFFYSFQDPNSIIQDSPIILTISSMIVILPMVFVILKNEYLRHRLRKGLEMSSSQYQRAITIIGIFSLVMTILLHFGFAFRDVIEEPRCVLVYLLSSILIKAAIDIDSEGFTFENYTRALIKINETTPIKRTALKRAKVPKEIKEDYDLAMNVADRLNQSGFDCSSVVSLCELLRRRNYEVNLSTQLHKCIPSISTLLYGYELNRSEEAYELINEGLSILDQKNQDSITKTIEVEYGDIRVLFNKIKQEEL